MRGWFSYEDGVVKGLKPDGIKNVREWGMLMSSSVDLGYAVEIGVGG